MCPWKLVGPVQFATAQVHESSSVTWGVAEKYVRVHGMLQNGY